MTQLAIQVSDVQKAALLVELLSSLDFVEEIMINDEDSGFDQSYLMPHTSSERMQMLKEEAAFDAMRSELLNQYREEFVAIYQQQVIDHDPDELALVERICESYPDETVLIRQVLETPEPPLVFRSPRFSR